MSLRSPRQQLETIVLKRRRTSKLLLDMINNMWRIIFIYLTLVIIGGLLFSIFEGKSWWDGSWWAVITSLSIGYGDLFPVTIAGRALGIFVGAVGIMLIVPIIIGLIIKDALKDQHKFTDCEQRFMFAVLHLIWRAVMVLIKNQVIIVKNQTIQAEMTVRIGKELGIDLAQERSQIKSLTVSNELEGLNQAVGKTEEELREENTQDA